MRVLLAFDKFKDSLTAPEACELAAEAVRATRGDAVIDPCPLADGGEGFCPILTRATGGKLIPAEATGPRMAPARGAIGLVPLGNIPPAARSLLQLETTSLPADATIAIIEMASVSGLALLGPAERDPWQTTTLGTGELIRLAISQGAAAILLGVGGSATNDLGLGALAALGLDFISDAGERISPPVPARWDAIARIAGRVSPAPPPIRIACDVTNPLLGPRGAAATYGPQKGLQPADLPRLEQAGARLARLLCAHCGKPETLMDAPGTGAAGGISFGLMAAANARLLPGADLVSTWLDLDARMAAADVVITGEGRFDDSSLQGKGPGAIAARALALGKRVLVFAGSATVQHPPPGLALHSITPAGTPLAQALREAPRNLTRAVREAFASSAAAR